MIKKLTIVILFLTLMIALTSCGGGNNSNPDQVTITFWHTTPIGDPGYSKINQLVKDFNATHPNIKVKHIGYSFWDYWDKLNIVVAARNGYAPDLAFNTLDNSVSRADGGIIYNLSPLIERDSFDLSKFYENQIAFGTYEGDIYSLPFTATARVLYYNLDLFEAAGLSESDVPTNWTELEEVAKKLDEVDNKGNISVMGFEPTAGDATFHNWLWMNNLDFFDANLQPVLDSDQHEAVLQWMKDFNSNFTAKQKQGFGESNKLLGLDPFTSGRVAMYVGTDGLNYTLRQKGVTFRYGVATIPYPEGGTRVNWGSGFSLEMFNNGDDARKEAAWEFYKYLMSDEVQKTYYETSGWLMANKTAMAEAAAGDEIILRIIDELPYTRDKVYVPYAPSWHGNDWQKFYQQAMNPEKDEVRLALKEAEEFYLEKQENYNATQ